MRTASKDFLTSAPDLTGSMFTLQDLNEARRVFCVAIQRYAPNWANTPTGVLGELWRQETRPATERLIDLAGVLYDLSRNITPQSAPAFADKVRQVLNCKAERQFEELIAELRVGAWLAARAGPVACEPLSRALHNTSGTRPRSPDFGIRLPENDILIEVTTLRIGALDHWERAMNIIRERISKAAVAAALAKEVEIHAPMAIRAEALTRYKLSSLIRAMEKRTDGETDMQLGSATAKIIWREIPFMKLPHDDLDLASCPASPFPSTDHFSAVEYSGGASISAASASKVVPVLGPNVDQLFVKSIRNTIDGKRHQFTIDAPSLLIIQPGAWRIGADYVRHIIDKRIWPNSQYSWLTGIGLLEPRRSFKSGAPPTRLIVSWNPNPRAPRTAALNDLINNNAWFSKGQRIEAPL